jgi:hypothetical protein
MEHAKPNSQEIEAKSHSPVPQGYVLGAEQGEHLIHFRDGGNIFIKVDPVTGSNNLGLGTQQLPEGSSIPVLRVQRILRLDRLRLRGLNGVRDEVLLTATAQNLRRLAKLLCGASPPLAAAS